MAKAFTEKERTAIREKIMETALDLFHEKGTKSLSIQELTRKVGIAQGSFYNFWPDKGTLVMDLICYRSSQKLSLIEKRFPHSLEDPVQFLTDIIYEYSVDLMVKVETQQIYHDAFKIFYRKNNGDVNYVKGLYIDFLVKLIDYWKRNKAIQNADEQGLSNAFVGSFVLCLNSHQFDQSYFRDVLRLYISSVVGKYIEL